MKPSMWVYAVLITLFTGLAACGGGSNEPASSTTADTEAGLSQAELEKGIGPIQQVEVGPSVDEALAAQGEGIFTTKCAACHKLAGRYVGPALGEVLSRRTPEYVMNMMLNPDEMVKRHPVVKELLAQYLNVMPNQNLTEDDARAVLEYLRANQTEAAAASE